jgi:16S rRNA (guanine966-N2)-methyltransferase
MAKQSKKSSNTGQALPGRLRIVAGKWGGRFLPVADAPGLRPTAERIRETLFNWLAPTIEGARCLDLFAGTGALGFEALSRGASEVTFVEQSPVAIAALRQAEYVLRADDSVIYAGDAYRFLDSNVQGLFDVVFLDPPFAAAPLTELCDLLQPYLTANAMIYIEQDKDQPPPALPSGWQILREKNAGMVRYSLVSAIRNSSKPEGEAA